MTSVTLRRDYLKKRELKLKQVLLLILLCGIVIRIGLIFNSNTTWDATYYIAMGRGFCEHGEFEMEWGDVEFGDYGTSFSRGYSHHYSPMFPLYLSAFYSISGYSFFITKVASVIGAILFLLVSYYTTKSLYDKDKALIVCAFFSVSYPLIWSTMILYTENFVMIFFMLTMWGILKGIDDDRYMIWAGLFAGLGYLTKASVGYFFIIAGGMGFIWRFYYMRWEVFKKKYYLMAIAIFLSLVGIWAFRNIQLFGWPNWETSYYITYANDCALSRPVIYLREIFFSLIVFIILLSTVILFFSRELKDSLKMVKDEHYSGLWLSVFILVLIGICISGSLAVVEESGAFLPDRIRYVIPIHIPLIWLFVKDRDFKIGEPLNIRFKMIFGWIKRTIQNHKLLAIMMFFLIFSLIAQVLLKDIIRTSLLILGTICISIKDHRKRLLIILIAFLMVSINGATQVRYTGPEEAGLDLENHILKNETLAIYTQNKYAIYPYIENLNFKVVGYSQNCCADWLISDTPIQDQNYTLFKSYKNHNSLGIIFLIKHLIISGENLQQYYDREPEYFLYKYKHK